MFAIFARRLSRVLRCSFSNGVVEPDALARVARSTGRTPPAAPQSSSWPDLPFLSENAEIIELAVARPWIPSYPRVSVQLQTMLEAVLTGRLGPPPRRSAPRR